MLYLSGTKNKNMRQQLSDGTIGLLHTKRASYSLHGVKVWAVDNGCFTGQYPGDDVYMDWLETQKSYASGCLFVAAPDVLGDAAATLANWPRMSKRIARAGWSPALVGQDGMSTLDLPDDLPWLFVGGSTEWKLSLNCKALILAAQARGARIHIGRVNSARRYRRFADIGCDSADGTHIGFGPDKYLPQVLGWMDDHKLRNP